MAFTYEYTYDQKGKPKKRLFSDEPYCEITVIPSDLFEVDKKGKKMAVFNTRKVLKLIVAITTPEERRPFEIELMKIPQWYAEYMNISVPAVLSSQRRGKKHET